MVKTRTVGDGTSAAEKIELKPIGFVKTTAVGKEVRDGSSVSEIILREEISNEERKTMKVHPRGEGDIPLLGVFYL